MLIQNPVGAGLAPLSILCNMLIMAAITKISFLGHILLICRDTRDIFVSTPRFGGSLLLIKPCLTRFGYLHMQYIYANKDGH